jgi:hypothetical protein
VQSPWLVNRTPKRLIALRDTRLRTASWRVELCDSLQNAYSNIKRLKLTRRGQWWTGVRSSTGEANHLPTQPHRRCKRSVSGSSGAGFAVAHIGHDGKSHGRDIIHGFTSPAEQVNIKDLVSDTRLISRTLLFQSSSFTPIEFTVGSSTECVTSTCAVSNAATRKAGGVQGDVTTTSELRQELEVRVINEPRHVTRKSSLGMRPTVLSSHQTASNHLNRERSLSRRVTVLGLCKKCAKTMRRMPNSFRRRPNCFFLHMSCCSLLPLLL